MPGFRRVTVLVSVWLGSVRYASRSWRAERALGPGEGPEGFRGTGETGPWGVSRVPRYLHLPPAERNDAVCAYCRAQRGARCTFHGHPCWFSLHFPRSFVRRLLVLLCTFLGHWCGGVHRQCGSGLVPLVSVYSRSRDGGSPTSVTSRLGVGVRSGN